MSAIYLAAANIVCAEFSDTHLIHEYFSGEGNLTFYQNCSFCFQQSR